MRIQPFSDLHVGVAPVKKITVRKDVDAVVVAGDICEGAEKAFVELRRIVPENIPIVMTGGNHEFYRRVLREELDAAKAVASSYNVLFLENDAVLLGRTRFVGATLWTNYRVFGEANAAVAMDAARRGMNDHRLIKWQKSPWLRFRPEEALLLHERSRAFIADALATPFPGPTVVVTHHAPHFGSVPPQYQHDLLTAAFASDLSELIMTGDDGAGEKDGGDLPESLPARIWIHGHIHSSSDYFVGRTLVGRRTRILANPHGYGAENPAFDPQLVVEVA